MKILLAIDGSPHSDAAIREVARHNWPAGTEIRVVTVDAPLGGSVFFDGTSGIAAYDEIVRYQRRASLGILEAGAALLRQLAPGLNVSAELLEGVPKEEIIAEARRWGADIIALGSHGRGAVKSLFLGSVSLAVVTSAPCSVLIVRVPEAS
nr:MAG: universal stress protein [Chloroflexota bacterium]